MFRAGEEGGGWVPSGCRVMVFWICALRWALTGQNAPRVVRSAAGWTATAAAQVADITVHLVQCQSGVCAVEVCISGTGTSLPVACMASDKNG